MSHDLPEPTSPDMTPFVTSPFTALAVNAVPLARLTLAYPDGAKAAGAPNADPETRAEVTSTAEASGALAMSSRPNIPDEAGATGLAPHSPTSGDAAGQVPPTPPSEDHAYTRFIPGDTEDSSADRLVPAERDEPPTAPGSGDPPDEDPPTNDRPVPGGEYPEERPDQPDRADEPVQPAEGGDLVSEVPELPGIPKEPMVDDTPDVPRPEFDEAAEIAELLELGPEAATEKVLDTITQVLAREGHWGLDAHYLLVPVKLEPGTIDLPATDTLARVNDYSTMDTFRSPTPESPGPMPIADQAAYHQALVDPGTPGPIITVQFYENAGTTTTTEGTSYRLGANSRTWYMVYRPDAAQPGSHTSYFTETEPWTNQTTGEQETIVPPIGLGAHDRHQAIIMSNGPEGHPQLADIAQAQHLLKVYAAARKLLANGPPVA